MLPILPQHKHHIFGPYLAEMPVDPRYCDRLLKLGKKLKTSYRDSLVGQIEHEYVYPVDKETWIFNGFQIYINTWIDGYRRFSNKPKFNPKYQIMRMWINQMKAKEYNPVHIHTRCDLSFVLFLEVPQKMLNEAKTKITTAPNPGELCFFYGEEGRGVVTERHVTPSVNTLMIFPSDLRHHVVHFNSKVIRTSVSGNIKFA
jgi:hypothetical protein